MDFFSKMKSFLGFPSHEDHSYNERFHSHVDEEDNNPFPSNPNNFHVFTDPLEMQKYFEQQMNHVMRSFGAFGFGDFGSSFGFFDHSQPQIEEAPASDNLREQYLKPGYENPSMSDEKPLDKDLDNKLDMRDLDSIFRGNGQRQLAPETGPYFSQTRVFGQSITSQTIRKPDGSIEIHKTVRDNQGNEETTITHQKGDQKYTITKRRDKDGKEEVIKDLFNLDEKDVPLIEGPSGGLFDRFFK